MSALARLAGAILAAADGAAVLVLPQGASLPAELAAHVGQDRLFLHPADPPIWQPAREPPICLGPADTDAVAARPTPWPASLLPVRTRIRRCDTLYAGQPLDLLLIAAPADIPAILSGAAACLRSGRTVVVLALQGAPEAAATLAAARALLPAHGWHQADTALWYALPPQRNLTVPAAFASPPTAIAIACDNALICTGLHPTEPGEPSGGRWTGAAMQTRLYLPRPQPGPWRLWFGVADWGNAPDGFDAGLEGTRLPPAERDTSGFGNAPIAIPPGPLALALDLYPPLGARDLIRWPRRIGTRLLAIRFIPP